MYLHLYIYIHKEITCIVYLKKKKKTHSIVKSNTKWCSFPKPPSPFISLTSDSDSSLGTISCGFDS